MAARVAARGRADSDIGDGHMAVREPIRQAAHDDLGGVALEVYALTP